MNWLDIVFLCLAGAGLIKGLYDGMIRQVVALGALILGIYLSTGATGFLRGYLMKLDGFPEQMIYPASCFLGFVLIVGVILLAGRVIHNLVSATPLSIFNHIGGGFLGLLLMILFMSFMLNIIEFFDTNSALLPQEIKVESRFYKIIKEIIPDFFPGNLFDINLKI